MNTTNIFHTPENLVDLLSSSVIVFCFVDFIILKTYILYYCCKKYSNKYKLP